MKLPEGKLITGIVLACTAPTVALNIWPRVERMLSAGISGNEVGIVILVTMSALGMAAVPFAMKKAENWGFWSICLVFGVSLACLNYVMAVGAIGRIRDHEALRAGSQMDQALRLKEQLQELKARISGLPTHKPTSDQMVAAADLAVKLATESRDQECGRVGDFCRARVAQLSTRLSEQATVLVDRATSREREVLEAATRDLLSKLEGLGELPASTDPQAARVATVLGAVFRSSYKLETVADGIISALAVTAELFALLMPRILVTALARPGMPIPSLPAIAAHERKPPAKLSLPPPPAATPLSVRAWYTTSLKPIPGAKLSAWDCFLFYKQAAGKNAVSFSQFRQEMEGSLGVKQALDGKKPFYLNLGVA